MLGIDWPRWLTRWLASKCIDGWPVSMWGWLASKCVNAWPCCLVLQRRMTPGRVRSLTAPYLNLVASKRIVTKFTQDLCYRIVKSSMHTCIRRSSRHFGHQHGPRTIITLLMGIIESQISPSHPHSLPILCGLAPKLTTYDPDFAEFVDPDTDFAFMCRTSARSRSGACLSPCSRAS